MATAVHNVVQGGIRVPYIKAYIMSIKLTWIKKLAINTEITEWQKLLRFLHPELR